VYFHPQKIIEVSTFRKGPVWEDESSIPIEAENNQWGTPEDDAFRRDLTINALFLDPLEMKVLDYVGGMVDLRERRIRVIGNPEVRFREDPVRTIRVIRHSARNSFVIDPHTWSSLLKSVPLIRSCNPNRVKQEFIREFQEGALHNSLKLLYRSELLLYLLPPLQEFLLSLESRLWKKRIYWRLLKMADEEFHRTPLPLTLNLACALGPAIYPEILGVGVPVIPKEELAHRFRPFLRFLGVPQKIGEEVGEILSSQGKLDLLRSEGKYPERLKEKRYFPLAFRLALFRYLAMGISIPEEWERRVPPVKGEKIELKPIPGEPGRFRIVTRTVRG
jgi:poly(A) polymerase